MRTVSLSEPWRRGAFSVPIPENASGTLEERAVREF